jgi:hypothetical protein
VSRSTNGTHVGLHDCTRTLSEVFLPMLQISFLYAVQILLSKYLKKLRTFLFILYNFSIIMTLKFNVIYFRQSKRSTPTVDCTKQILTTFCIGHNTTSSWANLILVCISYILNPLYMKLNRTSYFCWKGSYYKNLQTISSTWLTIFLKSESLSCSET